MYRKKRKRKERREMSKEMKDCLKERAKIGGKHYLLKKEEKRGRI